MAGAKETDRDRCHISDFVYYMAFTCTIDHTLKKKETSPQWVYEGGEKVLSKRLNSMTVVTGLFGTPYRILQLKKKKSHVQITPAPIFIIMTHTLIPSSQRRSNRPSLPLKLLVLADELIDDIHVVVLSIAKQVSPSPSSQRNRVEMANIPSSPRPWAPRRSCCTNHTG